jgi:hypothetical protein
MQLVEAKALALERTSKQLSVRVTPRTGRSLALFWKGIIGVTLFFGLVVLMMKFAPSKSPGDNIPPGLLFALYPLIAIPAISGSLLKIRQDRQRERLGCVFDTMANAFTCGKARISSLNEIVAVHMVVDQSQPEYVKCIHIELATGKKVPVAPFMPLGGHYESQDAAEIAGFLGVKVVVEGRDYSPS